MLLVLVCVKLYLLFNEKIKILTFPVSNKVFYTNLKLYNLVPLEFLAYWKSVHIRANSNPQLEQDSNATPRYSIHVCEPRIPQVTEFFEGHQ